MVSIKGRWGKGERNAKQAKITMRKSELELGQLGSKCT